MDECLTNLAFVESQMALWQDLTEEEIFFENESEEAKEKTAANKKIGATVLEAIKKAIKAIKEMIRSIATNVGDFFDKLFMDKGEKAQFEKFEAMVQNDPELANKKITVKNFRAMNNAYDKAIRAAEEARKNNEEPEKANAIMDMLKKGLLVAGATVGIKTAIDLAKSNRTVAKGIKTALNTENGICEILEQQVGKAEVEGLKKDVDKLSRDTFWSRCITKLIGKKANDNKVGMGAVVGAIKSAISGSTDPKDKANQLRVLADVTEKHPKAVAGAARVAAGAMDAKRGVSNFFGRGKKKKDNESDEE